MNILITADLHLDLWADDGRDPFTGILPVLRNLDALIIAGDLANDPRRSWSLALSRLGRLVPPARIWVVPGNHDCPSSEHLAQIGRRLAARAPRLGFDVMRRACRDASADIRWSFV